MHLRIHRDTGDLDLITQQADQIRTKLRRIEDELRKKREDPETDEFTLQALETARTEAREAYRKAQEALGKVRTDDALDPSRMPNISYIQRPTKAFRVRSERRTTLAIVLVISGPVLGLLYSLVPRR